MNRKITASISMGVLLFILNILSGLWVVKFTGIPLSGIVIMGVISGFVFAVSLLVINYNYTLTLLGITYSFLALFTPVCGPPGFILKVPIVIISCLIGDILHYFFKKISEKMSIVIASMAVIVVVLFLFAVSFYFFLPNDVFTKFIEIFPFLVVVGVFEVVIGVIFGIKVYEKIKNSKIVLILRDKS
jgi:hypothetical protein